MKAGYECKRCKLKRMDVEVRERTITEDIVNYLHHVARICGEHHEMLSPVCPSRVVDVYLPMSKAGIGIDGPPLDDKDRKQIDKQLKD